MNNKIKTAGGIVIKNNKILFILKKNKWDLPKGKLEKGNTLKETALIEVSEETGLPQKKLKILKKLIPTFYYKKVEKKTILKKTDWYLIEFAGKEKTPLIPDKNEGITKCKWFSLNEINVPLKKSHQRIKYLIEFCIKTPFYQSHIRNV